MIIGNKSFNPSHEVYIMGILNVTPDSFSDGGIHSQIDKALFHVEQMIREGADLIDVGGESTRPGYDIVSIQEEIMRTAPIIEKIKANFDIPISLDTYKSEVVLANLGQIDMVNDIWGLKYDMNMAKVVADANLACCLMHNRQEAHYLNFFDELITDLKSSLSIAREAGIHDDKIILDGGVGFAKSYTQNLEVIQKTDLLCALGYPVLLGTSRKSVVGLTLDQDVQHRLYGTLATATVGIMNGASFLRVHDVAAHRDVILMTKSILEAQKWTKSN